QVKFTASHGFQSMEGDIALDDIEFAHCGLPEPKLSCSTNELQCQRGSCVSLDRLCDFSDDCGDQTDEKHCEHYMGCDFENGLCNWEQEVDEDDLSWTHNSPSNIFNLLPDTGSKRDHTWNLDTGFYVYLDTSFSKEGRKAWLKSPALYASSENACKLRFFYHMHGKNIGSLKVYTRVFNDGTLMERWTRSGEVGNYFVRTEVILPAGQPFQVIIEGVVGNGLLGFIVLDDISFTPDCHMFDGFAVTESLQSAPLFLTTPFCLQGEALCKNSSNICISEDKICDFVGDCPDGSDETHCGTCSFETSACGWNDVSRGHYKWRLEMANISATPGIDHTLGTSYG
uniref:MAM domain-containing protein n=1 Tax=Latimeria chalumnae TaxID=7897 RepID=H3B4N6_LATCH